jgi:hypothetical protein
MQQLCMQEVILELHSDVSPPATYNRNNQRQPIDGLWATPGITILRGGYLAFGDGCPSDHRGLWFDIEYSVAFGHSPPNLAPPQPKHLKVKDPRVVKKYLKSAKNIMSTTGYQSRYNEFKSKVQVAQDSWDSRFEREYNYLQQENTQIRADSEQKIRRLTMGGVPWSAEIQLLRDKIMNSGKCSFVGKRR